MNKNLLLLISLLFFINGQAQTSKERYESIFETLVDMLDGNKSMDFKRAVFLVEDSYLEGQLDSVAYEKSIKFYKSLCQQLVLSRNLQYEGEDKIRYQSMLQYLQ